MEQNIAEIMELVRELTERYTTKESTSVSYEKAQQLLGAVLYCIEERERTRGSFDIIQAERKETVREIYEAGYQMVVEKAVETRKTYNELAERLDDYESRALRETFDALTQFFLYYDARFYPQNHILGLDYPVLFSLENLYGIDRISAWLECVRLEQVFLGSFSREYVIAVLQQYSSHYRQLFDNLGRILLRRLLGNLLLGSPAEAGKRGDEENEKLAELVLGCEREELEQECYELLEEYCEQTGDLDERLVIYLNAGAADIVTEYRNAAEEGILWKI